MRNVVARCIAGLLALLIAGLPAGSRAAAFSNEIVLEIFPLAALGDVDPAAGTDLSLRLSDEITSLGGVRVLLGHASTSPADYGSVSRAAGAGYYLTGSIAIVGAGVAVIVQVVSTRSGTVLWSSTVQLSKVSDITGEGALVREMLLARDQRPYLDLGSPSSAPPPAPAHAASPTPFTRPLPIPSDALTGPVAADAADAGPPAVVMLGFAAQPPLRDVAQRSLAAALAKAGWHAGADPARTGALLAIWGDRICTETSARLLLSGTVAVDDGRKPDPVQPELMTAHVQLLAYDCGRHVLETPVTRSSASLVWTTAVDRAVSGAVGAIAARAPISGGL